MFSKLFTSDNKNKVHIINIIKNKLSKCVFKCHMFIQVLVLIHMRHTIWKQTLLWIWIFDRGHAQISWLIMRQVFLREKNSKKKKCSANNLTSCFMATVLNSPYTNESVHNRWHYQIYQELEDYFSAITLISSTVIYNLTIFIFIAPACSRVRYRRLIVRPSVCLHLCLRSTFMSKLVF